jgi:hypothetical protein
MKEFVYFLLLTCAFGACSLNRGTSSNNAPPESPAAAMPGGKSSPASTSGEPEAKKGTEIADAIPVTKRDCENTDVGDSALLKTQTFPVAFEPFKNTCFVTSYNPEYDDPPMESEMGIYKGDKKIFDFPDQFNGVTTGCWVDAVAFQDLNADGLTDIIVVGKCSAKTAPYNENMVYVNTGKGFTTSDSANYEVAELKKAGDIANFVKRNQQLFFK